MKEQFERYIERVFKNIPNEVFEWGLILFCIGTLGIFVFLGWNRGWRNVARLLLVEYLTLIYCSTVIFRAVKDGIGHNFLPFWSYEAIRKGKEFFIAETIMNVALFVPVGLMLGCAFRSMTWWKTLLIGCGISVSIEVLQYYSLRGFAEVDDVIHNTIGCLIGFGIFSLGRFGYERIGKRSVEVG